MKNRILQPFTALFVLTVISSCSPETQENSGLQPYSLSSVSITGGPFLHASRLNEAYVLAHDPDRLLAPFLIDAGLEAKAKRYGNWENSGLDGHTAGHVLSALAMIVAGSVNKEASEMLIYMVDQLAECQAANGNGYVGGIPGGQEIWEEIAAGTINATSFSLNGKWVPWYNIHKLYAGLRDAWLYTGNEKALDILTSLSDWAVELVSDLTEDQIQEMLIAEHGGMNEVFADVYEITGDDRYAKLARQFSHREILDPLLNGKDQLTGLHANTQIPKVIGFNRVAEVCEKPDWENAARFFWDAVVNHRSVAFGGNSVSEHFNPADDFSSVMESREGPETCNTYNMMRLAKHLYFSSGDLKYIDYYERALYNHILPSQHPEHGGLVYFTPVRPGHYRVYSNPEKTFWCCVGSGIENHAKYGELVYARDPESLFVNLFIPTQLHWAEKGVTLVQETAFPESEMTSLVFRMDNEQTFDLNIRHPAWLADGEMTISVNGEPAGETSNAGSYFRISRTWRDDDQVTVRLPMHTYGEYLPDGSPFMAVLHGPVVLAAETGTDHLDGLVADDSRMGQVASGVLYPRQSMPMLVIKDEQWPQKLVKTDDTQLSFDISELVYSEEGHVSLRLIPFYRLHDSRYIMYWQTGTRDELKQSREELARHEDSIMILENQTISRVTPGQQQPESEHNFRGEETTSGVLLNRHWRQSGSWFAYDLSDPGREARVLRLTWYGGDDGRHFNIYVNDNHIAEVVLDGSDGDDLTERSFALPVWIINNREDGLHTVRFEAIEGSTTGRLFDVRLLR